MAGAYKILYLHEASVFGGGEQSLLNLVINLDKQRFTPRVACPSGSKFAHKLDELGVKVFPVSYPGLKHVIKVGLAIQKIRRIILAESIALVHANSPRTNLMGAIAARSCGIPIVWHARNMLGRGMVDLDCGLLFLPDKIICNSEAVRGRFKGSKKAAVILNGVDLREFHPGVRGQDFRREFGLDRQITLIGIIGRLDPIKGHPDVIRAIAQVLQQGQVAHLVIVGDYTAPECRDYKEDLDKLIASLNLREHVAFTGFRSDIPQVIAGLDIVVLATEAEACGRALLEAQACGKPVIATDSGGTPELVADGETGILAPPNNPDRLAQAMLQLLKDKDWLTRMGRAGRVRAEKYFSIERHIQETVAVYQELLADEHWDRH